MNRSSRSPDEVCDEPRSKGESRQRAVGFTHVDAVIALFMFLTAVTVAFFTVQTGAFRPDLSDISKEASISLANKLSDRAQWSLMKERLVVDSSAAIEWPVEISANLSGRLDLNSVVALNGTNYWMPTDYDNSEKKAIFDGVVGANSTFYIVYGENTSLSAASFNSSLNVTENSTAFAFNTAKINGTITGSGLSNVKWDNVLLVNSANLATNGVKPTNRTGQARAKFFYDDTNVSIYNNGSKTLISKTSSETITVQTSTSLVDKYYNGSIIDLGSAGATVDSGTYSWIDFYNSSASGNGFSIIGNSMTVTVTKSGTAITATISGVTSFEIFLHQGNYTNAQSEKNVFLSPPAITVKNPVKITGISASKAAQESAKSYSDLKSELGANFNFNYSIDEIGISFGTTIPKDRAVIVQRFPIINLDRFGNTSSVKAGIAIWD